MTPKIIRKKVSQLRLSRVILLPFKNTEIKPMINLTRTFYALTTVLILTACASKTIELEPNAVYKQYPAIKELKLMIADAEKTDLPNLAPKGYQQAVEDYNRAYEGALKQVKGANEIAENGLINLRLAISNAESSKVVLREVLDARKKTVEANAPTIFPEKFNKLESELKSATKAIEGKDVEEAKQLRAELIKAYADMELSALKHSTTREARIKIAEAKNNRADDYAPKTLKLAEEELSLALDILSAGRTQTKKAEEHAALSAYYAERSKQIAEMVMDFDQRDFSAEDTLLWYQDQLEIINKPFGEFLGFDKPNYNVVNELRGRINFLIAQLDQKQSALVSANENIAMLEGQVESIDAQFKQDKQANKEAQARYKKIRNMFNEQEAYVFRQGNNVLLETHAFNFKVGNSEIDSNNYSLLEKIMDAIHVFENPDVVIMGHTDSTGGDATNMKLSLRRALTVTDFLKKIGKLPSNKISTKGYGESRPVASNETKKGRERNRRIEVLIVNK
jgi:OmpA-OmpF porin, OOP family